MAKTRTIVALVLLGLALAMTPTAMAKFKLSLVLGRNSPMVGQPFTVSLRTDVKLPLDHELLLVAVAPHRSAGDVVGTVTGASSFAEATIPRDGFSIPLTRVRGDRWRAIVTLPRKGRWQLVVPNWVADGYTNPWPLHRLVVVRAA